MTRLPPPLRFLAGMCAGWVCARAGAVWLSSPIRLAAVLEDPRFVSAPRPLARVGPAAVAVGSSPLQAPPAAAVASIPERGGAAPEAETATSPARERPVPGPGAGRDAPRRTALPPARQAAAVAPTPQAGPPALAAVPSLAPAGTGARAEPVAPLPGLLAPRQPQAGGRLTASAWLFLRRGGAASLAPAGMLGGSQAGARALYRLAGGRAPLSLSLRVSATPGGPAGAEAAAGLDWKPLPRLPVRLLLERRLRLGGTGRSAVAATVYGGGEAMLGPLRLDTYVQAGLVGLARRDPFADGAVRAALPIGAIRLGAGAWGAAQPGLARLDVGPHAALRLPALRAALAADWRFRAAGHARPGSGPALTLAADF